MKFYQDLEITGAIYVSESITVPFAYTTASYALNALTASFAISASFVATAETASFVQTAQTASRVLAANIVGTIATASFAISASWAPTQGGGGGASGVGFSRSLFTTVGTWFDGGNAPMTYSAMMAPFSESVFQFYGTPVNQANPSIPFAPSYGSDVPRIFDNLRYHTLHVARGGTRFFNDEFSPAGITIGEAVANTFTGIGIWSSRLYNYISATKTGRPDVGHLNITTGPTGSSNILVVKTDEFSSASVVINALSDIGDSNALGALTVYGNGTWNSNRGFHNIHLRDRPTTVNNASALAGIYIAVTGSRATSTAGATRGETLQFFAESSPNTPFFRAHGTFNNQNQGRFSMGYTSFVPATPESNAFMMPSNTITVSGSVFATAFNTTSDRRLKENVEGIQYGLDTINSLRPVEFNWIGDDNQDKKLGFIAQEVLEVVPEAVGGVENEGDYYQFDINTITPVNTKAIQELSVEVNELKATIETLVARIEALENK